MAGRNRFGSELGLIHEVTILGRKVGADRAFWKTLSQDEEMFRRVVELVKGSVPMAKPRAESEDIFKVTVDYTKSLADMILSGKYDYVNGDITSEHFPFGAVSPEQVEIRLVHLGREATTDEVLAELDKMNLRPATLAELLALGAAHPDLQRKFWMVALGSRWSDPDGRVGVPLLDRVVFGRGLDLRWYVPVSWWVSVDRFVAVCK
jgi:hypothetical protein